MSSQPLLKGLFDELDSFQFLTGPEASRPLIAPAETQLCTPDYQRVDVDGMMRHLALDKSIADRSLAQFLVSRGFQTGPELNAFLHPTLAQLPQPKEMKNLDQAAHLVREQLQAGNKIGVVGDYDVDGVTATAQIVRFCAQHGAIPSWHIPNRELDGYGISPRLVEKLINDRCSLVLLLDHGTHSISEVASLRSAGIKVIILDHHKITGPIADGLLINANQIDCGFSAHALCASALSAYLVWRMNQIQGGSSAAAPALDFAALGTVADMVPLSGVNRAIASLGIKQLQDKAAIGIRQLAFRLGIDLKELKSEHIGFYIGPAINAAGRLGDANQCVELLLTEDEEKARQIAATLVDLNKQRKDVQKSTLEQALARLASKGAQLTSITIDSDESNHQGVVGLISQALSQRYARPAISFAAGQEGTLRGSGRSGTGEFDLISILDEVRRLDQRGAVLKCGGHKAAGGLTIQAQDLAYVSELLESATAKLHPNPLHRQIVHSDFTTTFKQLKPSLVRKLSDQLEPFGQGLEPPRCYIENVEVTSVDKDPGLRMRLGLRQLGIERVGFVGPEIARDDINVGDVISLIATPISIYQNRREMVQLRIIGFNSTGSRGDIVPEPLREKAKQVDHRPLKIKSLAKPALKVTPKEKKEGPSKADILKEQINLERKKFPRAFIYPELESHWEDYLSNKPLPDFKKILKELMERYRFDIKEGSFTYRREQIECVRYVFDREPHNVIIQAPTGSGKTEVALLISGQVIPRGGRVLFLAPTNEIVDQVAGRSTAMLNIRLLCLAGKTPKQRVKGYQQNDPNFIVAVPHVIKNDLKSAQFSFRKGDLLVIDEAHHANGAYPFVPVVKNAIENGIRVIMLSATPSQLEPGNSWDRLEKLKELVGVKHIFPMNISAHQPRVTPIRVPLGEEIEKGQSILLAGFSHIKAAVIDNLEEIGGSDLITALRKISGVHKDRFPSSHLMGPLYTLAATHAETNDDYFNVLSDLRALQEFSELHDKLVYQGIAATLTQIVKARIALYIALGEKPGAYVSTVYNSESIRDLYTEFARGSFIDLWSPHNLRRVFALPTGLQPKTSEANIFLRNTESSLIERLNRELLKMNFENHPKETKALDILARHPSHQTLIFARDRAHVFHLEQKINHLLNPRQIVAGSFTGSGVKDGNGMSRTERAEQLKRFKSHELTTLICTSAGNEGIDLPKVKRVIAFRFSASHIESSQRQGRTGRGGVGSDLGHIVYLYSTGEEYGKYLTILRKDLAFVKMLNNERAEVVKEFAAYQAGRAL
jgi:single-stranded-DNA-specific exonuclease